MAVDPPPGVREQLVQWARGVARAQRALGRERGTMRLLDESSLHITLCFLGSRPVAEIGALASAVAALPDAPVELALGAPLWLPPGDPRSLAVEVHDPDGSLAELQALTARSLSVVSGWEPDRRRFRAHLTVARVRGGGHGRGRRERGRREGGPPPGLELAPTPQLRFAAESLSLYRSWLSQEGASYEALVTVELDGAS